MIRQEERHAGLDRRLGTYVVLDPGLAAGRSLLEVARAAIAGGAGTLQLRAKDWDGRDLVEAGRQLRRLTAESGALFIVNDRVDVALAVEADGVHVGERDIPVADARRILGPTAVIGFSPETVDSARRAVADGADYLGVGPVFATTSKPDAGAPIGLDGLRAVVEAVSVPLVAIGGIHAGNAASALRAGACGVAVISAVLQAADPRSATAELARVVRAVLAGGGADGGEE